jgi:hypothetical protein
MCHYRRLGTIAVVVTLILLVAIGVEQVTAPKAHAASVTCYGDYCSGQDPKTTGCAADAVTLAWKDLSGARLDLRWSPTCKTEWARWQQYPLGIKSDMPMQLGAVQDTGYTQSITYDVNGPGVGTTWTPMIYSPVHLVKAVAKIDCGSDSLLGTAVDCAMNGKVETQAF